MARRPVMPDAQPRSSLGGWRRRRGRSSSTASPCWSSAGGPAPRTAPRPASPGEADRSRRGRAVSSPGRLLPPCSSRHFEKGARPHGADRPSAATRRRLPQSGGPPASSTSSLCARSLDRVHLLGRTRAETSGGRLGVGRDVPARVVRSACPPALPATSRIPEGGCELRVEVEPLPGRCVSLGVGLMG